MSDCVAFEFKLDNDEIERLDWSSKEVLDIAQMIYMRSKNDSITLCVNPVHGLDRKGWSFLALKLNNFKELAEKDLLGKANLLALEFLQAYSSWRLEKYLGYRGYHETSSNFIYGEESMLETIRGRISKTIAQMKPEGNDKGKSEKGKPVATKSKSKTGESDEL